MIRLSLSCGAYDRTLPLLDGRVKPENIDLTFVPTLRPGSPMGSPEADIYEASITGVLIQKRTPSGHVPIPIFPRRKFTHQLLLTREDSKITSFEDFAGKRVGLLRWYEHPLGVWLRGDLQEKYGIAAADIRWFTEGENLIPAAALKGVGITVAPSGKSLVQMLVGAELDVLAHEEAQQILLQHRSLRRVFPEFAQAEAAYYRETGIFPSYHVLVVKEEIVLRHHWVVSNLIKAFDDAKELALHGLERDNSFVSSPWLAALLEKQYGLLPRDMYPYGLEPNRKELDVLLRYLYKQGLLPKPIAAEEVFAL